MECPKCGYRYEPTNLIRIEKVKPTKISDKGIKLVTHFEGKHNKSYLCPANVWTIGYGHTGNVDGKPIKAGLIISDEKVIELLKEDMAEFEKAVSKLVKVPITQNQFDALVSFAFNVGSGALRTSTLLKILNSGEWDNADIERQFLRWNKGGGRVLAGLTRRRKAEAHLWSNGELKFHF